MHTAVNNNTPHCLQKVEVMEDKMEAESTEGTEEAQVDEEDFHRKMVLAIAQSLNEGKSQSEIVDEFLDEDADAEARHEFSELVFNIANSMASTTAVHSEGVPSWVFWIVGLVVVNILSAAFDWPFWVY